MTPKRTQGLELAVIRTLNVSQLAKAIIEIEDNQGRLAAAADDTWLNLVGELVRRLRPSFNSRVSMRLTVNAEVDLKVQDRESVLDVMNVSLTGLCVRGRVNSLHVGDVVDIQGVRHDGVAYPFRAQGRVVWVRPAAAEGVVIVGLEYARQPDHSWREEFSRWYQRVYRNMLERLALQQMA